CRCATRGRSRRWRPPALGTSWAWAAVAWRPDGKEFAVDANTPNHAVVLYDCATGKQVASLVPPTAGGQGPQHEREPNVLLVAGRIAVGTLRHYHWADHPLGRGVALAVVRAGDTRCLARPRPAL